MPLRWRTPGFVATLVGTACLCVAVSAAPPPDRVYLGSTRELDDAWSEAAKRLTDGDVPNALVFLAKAAQLRRDLGVPNFFGMSDIVLAQGQRAADAGRSAEASALVEVADALAPDSPRPPVARARIALTGGDMSLGRAIVDLTAGLARHARDLQSLIVLRGRIGAACMLAVYVTLVLFTLVMVSRHGTRLLHAVSHLLPPPVRGAPFGMVAAVFLVVGPLSVGTGLVLLSFLWLILLWLYLTTTERVVAAALGGLVALTPALNREYAVALAYPGSVEQALYECTRGRCPPAHEARIEEHVDSGRFGADEKLTLGLIRKREGALGRGKIYALHDAVRYMKAALERAPQSYRAHVGLASVLVIRGAQECADKGRPGAPPELTEADALLAEAQRLQPNGVEAHYDRSVVLALLGKAEAAGAAHAEAERTDPARVTAWDASAGTEALVAGCPKTFAGNRRLMDALPPPAELRQRIAAQVDGSGAILVPFGQLLAGIVDARFMPLVGLACAGLLLLGIPIVRTLRPAFRCAECGRVACPRCRRELRHLDLCERCLFVRIKGAFVDSRDQWLSTRGREQSRTSRRKVARIAGLLVPGLGLLLRGRALAGATYLGLSLGLVSLALMGPVLVPELSVGASAWLSVVVFCGLCALIVYIAAALHGVLETRAK